MTDEIHIEYPKINATFSKSFARFLKEYEDNFDFFFFVVNLTSHADKAAEAAAKALANTAHTTDEREKYEKSLKNKDKMLNTLKKFAYHNSKNLTIGIVDNFLCYLSEITQEILWKRPEILNSSDTIKISDVMQYSRYRDLISHIIDKKIHEMSYGSMLELERYFQSRFGVEVFNNDDERTIVRNLIEIRNVQTHNRGFINDIFLRKIGNKTKFEYEIDEKFYLNFDEFLECSNTCFKVANNFDRIATQKFHIRKKKYQTWFPQYEDE